MLLTHTSSNARFLMQKTILLADAHAGCYFWRLMYRAYVKKQPPVSKTNRFFLYEPRISDTAYAYYWVRR